MLQLLNKDSNFNEVVFRNLNLAAAVALQDFSLVCRGLAIFFFTIALNFHDNSSPFKVAWIHIRF